MNVLAIMFAIAGIASFIYFGRQSSIQQKLSDTLPSAKEAELAHWKHVRYVLLAVASAFGFILLANLTIRL